MSFLFRSSARTSATQAATSVSSRPSILDTQAAFLTPRIMPYSMSPLSNALCIISMHTVSRAVCGGEDTEGAQKTPL